jgi:hypothetical protein
MELTPAVIDSDLIAAALDAQAASQGESQNDDWLG